MTGTLFQNAISTDTGFFNYPSVTLAEIRHWIANGAGHDGIGLGAVVDKETGKAIGEMVMVGGLAYKVGKSGKPEILDENATITFAQVGNFSPEISRQSITVSSKKDLQQQLAKLIPEPESEAYMVRVTGNFPQIDLRGVDTEGRDVSKVSKLVAPPNAQTHTYTDANSYTLVGVYSAKGAVEPDTTFDNFYDNNLHLHGVGTNGARGGHVVDFGKATVNVEIMPISKWLLATHEKALEGQSRPKIKWVNKMRIPKHMAQSILDMPISTGDSNISFKKYLESAHKVLDLIRRDSPEETDPQELIMQSRISILSLLEDAATGKLDADSRVLLAKAPAVIAGWMNDEMMDKQKILQRQRRLVKRAGSGEEQEMANQSGVYLRGWHDRVRTQLNDIAEAIKELSQAIQIRTR